VVKYGDSVQYWAAGRLTLMGENPYSAAWIQEFRHRANIFIDFPEDSPSMMLYPPWSIPFMLPFGIFNYNLSRLAWFAFHLVIMYFCAMIIWRMYQGPKKYYWFAIVITFMFSPTLYMLLMGHITSLHLLGLLGFLYFIGKQNQSNWTDLAAGACAGLMTIKPQLLFIFMLAILLWVISKHRWWILIGLGLLIFIGTIIPYSFNSQVISLYWSAMKNYSVGAWASPAIGTVLRRAVGYHIEWLQIIPSIIGFFWLFYYWFKNRKEWNWFETAPVLIFATYLASAYYWPYDMVVLLLPILIIFTILLRNPQKQTFMLILISYLLIFTLTVYHFLFIHNYYYYFWLVPAYLAWYLLGKWIAKKEFMSNTQTSSQQI
jgi:hypothetical protein